MESIKINIIILVNSIKEFILVQQEIKKSKNFSSEYNFFVKRLKKIQEEWEKEFYNIYASLPRRYRGRLRRLEKSLINKSFLEKNIKIDYNLINY